MNVRSASPGHVLAVAGVATFLVSLPATIGFALYPALQVQLQDASPPTLAGVLTAYTIVYGALLVPAGRGAELKGRKRLFLWPCILRRTFSLVRIRIRHVLVDRLPCRTSNGRCLADAH